jgi:RNA polymerase sigma-70 factor (ECF subfamily)
MVERICVLTVAESKMQGRTHPENLSALAIEAKTNPAAFSKLYDHYVQPIYRYLYSRIGSRHEAEDLTSQTFIAAYEALPRYRERGHFSAWLFRIAQSKLMDHFRGSRHEVELDAVERSAVEEDALNQVIQDEDLNHLKSLISRLNEKEQDLIRLRYVADLSFVEMAELLGKREATVRKSVHRLLARLKGQME